MRIKTINITKNYGKSGFTCSISKASKNVYEDTKTVPYAAGWYHFNTDKETDREAFRKLTNVMRDSLNRQIKELQSSLLDLDEAERSMKWKD